MSKCRSPDRNPGNEGHSEGAENGHWDRAGEKNRTLYNRTKRFSVQSSHTRCLILILFSPCEVAEHKKSGVCVCVAGSGAKEDKRHNCPRTRRDGPDMDTCPRPWSAVPSIPPATCPPTECTVTSAAARRDSVVTPDASQGRGDTDSDLICESHQEPEAVPWRGLNTVGTLILEPSIDVRLNAFQNNSHVLSPILPSPAITAVL